VGRSAGLDVVARRKNPIVPPRRKSNPGRPGLSLVLVQNELHRLQNIILTLTLSPYLRVRLPIKIHEFLISRACYMTYPSYNS